MSSGGLLEGGLRVGIGMAHLLARPLGGEHPGDAGALGVAPALPGGNLGLEALAPPMRRSRHWDRSTPISISTMFSQLACLGTKWKSSRRSTRRASPAGNASYSAPAEWVDRLSSTTRTCSASG